MNIEISKNKWNNIYMNQNQVEYAPAAILAKHDFLLPKTGTALDLACGLGVNALFLAAKGLQTTAWDVSPVAIEKLSTTATERKLVIESQAINITESVLAARCFDVIVVSRYLDRAINQAILQALKPDGLLFYQTFCIDKAHPVGPKNPDFILQRNELIELFAPLAVVYYQENAVIGEITKGFRNEAQFIGQKS